MSLANERLSGGDRNLPIVSLGMSVYNAGDFLRQAVISVIKQTFTNWELIIIDDQSTDNSLQTIADIDDRRIRVIESEGNRGLATRLNEAVGLARGRFFARMDQDDICHPERLEKQVGFLKAHLEVDLLGSQCVLIDERCGITGILPVFETHDEICRSPWKGISLAHPTWIGKREWFQQNPYLSPGPYFCEDQELLLRTHEKSRFHVLPEPLLAYRTRQVVNFSKSRRTRLTLMRLQWRYFVAHRKFLYAILSLLVCFGKIVSDYWHGLLRICARDRGDKGNSSSVWVAEWKQVVRQLQCAVDE